MQKARVFVVVVVVVVVACDAAVVMASKAASTNVGNITTIVYASSVSLYLFSALTKADHMILFSHFIYLFKKK